MPDETAMFRQWVLLKALSSSRNGLSIRDMSAQAGVNAKTIRRDLDLFRRLGFPLEETSGEFGRKTWRITSPAGQPPLGFNFDEALALSLGRRFLEPLAGTPFWEAAQRAFRKVRSALGPTALEYFERSHGFFHFTACGTHRYEQRYACIDTLLQAIEDGKAVHILYQSDRATEPAWRDVYPYLWTFHKHALYLLALDPPEGKVKTYKLDRIEEVELTRFPFPRPDEATLARLLKTSFGVFQGDGDYTVKIRFAPAAARYVQEGAWPCCQHLTRQRDGSLLAEFRLSALEEIKSWVLSFGRKAVVLEPEILRREIADELEALTAAYAAPVPRDQPARRPGTTAPA